MTLARRSRRSALALLAAAVAAISRVSSAPADERGVLVFAAASLKNALDAAAAAYRAATGGEVTVSYAATPALARQIEQGAPAAMLVSADLAWMDYLQERDLIDPATRGNLLGNRLVLVASKDSAVGRVAIGPGLDLAGLLGDGRLAVAEVEAVPAGRYAKAALEKLGVWRAVSGRLAQAENARAALALVSRGEAPLGIVYRTDAVADPDVHVVGTFPADSHPPIVYPVALTVDAPEPAMAFLAFLRAAPAARAAFARAGFVVLGPPAS